MQAQPLKLAVKANRPLFQGMLHPGCCRSSGQLVCDGDLGVRCGVPSEAMVAAPVPLVDDSLRRDVISVVHGFGGLLGDAEHRAAR